MTQVKQEAGNSPAEEATQINNHFSFHIYGYDKRKHEV